MNKALLFLLVTLVQSQSDGVLLGSPNASGKVVEDGVEEFRAEGWDSPEVAYPDDLRKDVFQKSTSYRKRSVNDVLTRRSALDKNFMRFGRSSPDTDPDQYSKDSSFAFSKNKANFFRIGRGVNDNFIRFGRGTRDNFIRFGRGNKDSFIRFGRGDPSDFFRAGKSLRENFIRFGKADENFLKFNTDADNDEETQDIDNRSWYDFDGFERSSKTPKSLDNFIRFGRSGNQKEGRNGTNFLRFGKKEAQEAGEDTEDDEDRRDPVLRAKRGAPILALAGTTQAKKKETAGDVATGQTGYNQSTVKKRSPSFFEKIPEGFPRRLSPLMAGGSWQLVESLENSRLTPFFPVTAEFSKTLPEPKFNFAELKRSQGGGGGGGSNFIRFG